jgi:hypothetical protein
MICSLRSECVSDRIGWPARGSADEIMQMYVALQPLVALIAGILILIIPRLLNYIVAIYLIVVGILGLVKV